jgi:4a-hydroxytetrahydrobiopterin dehydratase
MTNPILLTADEITQQLGDIISWTLSEDGLSIQKIFSFKNYYHTMAFVNAVAWIAHQQDHHPDMTVGYNKCKVTYSTHSAGGITKLDIEAAKQIEDL